VESFQDKSSLERPKAIGNMYAQPISPTGNGRWQKSSLAKGKQKNQQESNGYPKPEPRPPVPYL
jgi:hypothetical protein